MEYLLTLLNRLPAASAIKGPGSAMLSQVWIFDPATSQWDETDCGDPLRRRDHLGAYDGVTGEHILIGGRVSTIVGNFYDRGMPAKMDVRIRVRQVGLARPGHVNLGSP